MSVPPQQPPGPGQPGGPSPYGPPPGGGQPYGSSPYPGQQPPYPPPAPRGPVEKPKEVETAFRLGLLSVLLGVIGVALGFALSPVSIDATIASGQVPPGVTTEQFRQITTVILVGIAVVWLIFLALYVLFLFKMRAGRNWARIVITILGAIAVLFTLFGIGSIGQTFAMGPIGVVSGVLSIVQLLTIIAGIVFMFRPAAGPYFRQERDY
ncbi:hypothetical protein ACQEVB_17775 [Pseudonocardia sp. CA-107938]|uniref:hypothetical protein n=1 Tax=Pseudonocardia sp. CA-107938 TaxID=3240021 RepID=UPI003D8A99FA